MAIIMKKIYLFLIISWLVARLKLTIELSRLAIFKLMPKAQIHEVSNISKSLPLTLWNYEENRVSFLCFDPLENQFLINEFPPISGN